MIELDILSLNGIKKLLACAELFSKAKSAEVNDEIIVLTGKDEDIDNILSWTTQLNYKVTEIESYNEHDLNNIDRNIILIARNSIPFDILKNSNKKFLILESRSIVRGVDNYEKFNIKNKNSYSTFTQKRNPMELIFKDTQIIIECLSLVLEPSISSTCVHKDSISLLRNQTDEEISHWQQRILVDIDLLEEQRILTFKLARVIYIIATLNDYVSDKEVYSFYQNNLGSLKYNNAYKEFWEVSNVRSH